MRSAVIGTGLEVTHCREDVFSEALSSAKTSVYVLVGVAEIPHIILLVFRAHAILRELARPISKSEYFDVACDFFGGP